MATSLNAFHTLENPLNYQGNCLKLHCSMRWPPVTVDFNHFKYGSSQMRCAIYQCKIHTGFKRLSTRENIFEHLSHFYIDYMLKKKYSGNLGSIKLLKLISWGFFFFTFLMWLLENFKWHEGLIIWVCITFAPGRAGLQRAAHSTVYKVFICMFLRWREGFGIWAV